jgi:hypothetical protein
MAAATAVGDMGPHGIAIRDKMRIDQQPTKYR